jgi:ribosome-associated heat shock protein Hsp15
MSEKLRIDIWLHRARLYKSRTQATSACRESKIMIGEKFVDPGNLVGVGDLVKIRVSGLYRAYRVNEVADINLSKQDAKRMYDDVTAADVVEKFRQVEEHNRDWRATSKKESGARPTKKGRRSMDKLRGR